MKVQTENSQRDLPTTPTGIPHFPGHQHSAVIAQDGLLSISFRVGFEEVLLQKRD